MGLLNDISHDEEVGHHRPWPRAVVAVSGWKQAIELLARGRCVLFGLWGDGSDVHMALLDDKVCDIVVISYACEDGKYPSVAAIHPPAIRLERAINDLFGLQAVGLPDTRAWLDLGFWDVSNPLGKQIPAKSPKPYTFLPVVGEGLHQIPVGPVHAGIIEPGHFRFTANGERVVRLEQRLGYVHKGIEKLMQGSSLTEAAKLAARTSGDSTVAFSYAFAQGVEAALNITPPLRASYMRALMAELERIANHLGDIGAICNDASFSVMHAQTSILRERAVRAAEFCFGHRLMMDVIIPGGVARDMTPKGISVLREFLVEVRKVFPRLIELYDNTASLQDRTVATGIVRSDYARQFGAGGFVGRASGRAFDVRRFPGYSPYSELEFDVPVLDAGDVNARVWIRIREVEQSLRLIEQILDRLPEGKTSVPLKSTGRNGEGVTLVEAFRGDVLVWVRLDSDGRVGRCHLRDASWFQWPLLEVAIEDNIVADFPLCNKSFNCSYSGHDL